MTLLFGAMRVFVILLILVVSNSLADDSAYQAALDNRARAVTRLRKLATELRMEANHGSTIADTIKSTSGGGAQTLRSQILRSKSGIENLIKPQFVAPFSEITPPEGPSLASRRQLLSTSVQKNSQSLSAYAQKLNDLANAINKAPPEQTEAMLDATQVPHEVAVVIDPVNIVSTNGLGPLIGGGGAATVDYPAVAAILYDDGSGGLYAGCSGTLIAPYVILTAAHCLKEEAPKKVYLHHAGLYTVAGNGDLNDLYHYDANPKFDYVAHPDAAHPFKSYADVGLIFLTESVVGIAGAPINNIEKIASQTTGRIIGFGAHNASLGKVRDHGNAIDPLTGIKVDGQVTTSSCGQNIPESSICWSYDPSLMRSLYGTTCPGDSGGPLIVQIGGVWRVAGVTSESDCKTTPGQRAVDEEVFDFSPWISSELGKHPAPQLRKVDHYSPDLDPLAETVNDIYHLQFRVLPPGNPNWSGSFSISADFNSMQIAVNATDSYSSLNLVVSLSAGGVGCSVNSDQNTSLCEVLLPAKGTWKISISGLQNQEYQLVVDAFRNN